MYRVLCRTVSTALILLIGCGSEPSPADGGPVEPVDAGVPVGPEVDAGPDQVVDGGATVRLAGALPDAGEGITTAWTQLSGPAVTLDGADTLEPSFRAPELDAPVGLLFRLEATNAQGGVGADEVVVVVVPVTEGVEPPMVDAGDDTAVAEETVVTLSGSVEDPGGAVTSTRWVQIVGEPVALDDPSALETTFVAPATVAETILAFRLEALGDGGLLALDDVTVAVFTTHTAPTVDAGSDQTVAPGELVALSGTTTAEGVVRTEWTQFAGPSVTLDDPTALATSFVAPATDEPLTLGFRLEVEDARGEIGFDHALVTVVPPPNQPPVADAGPDQSAVSGETVSLAGAASDADGLVARTTWTEVGTSLITLSDPAALDATFVAPDVSFATTLTLELEVEDDDGATATDRVAISVSPSMPVNQPPVVSAGADQTLASGSAVTLFGAATDPDGTVASTTWTQVSGPAVTLADPSALTTSFTAPTVACAVLLVFELEAIDDAGARAADRVSILVDGVTAAPIATGSVLDLDADDGGLVTEGTAWQWGVPTSGPGEAFTGTRVWATELGGNYVTESFEVLCMPPIDLGGASDPVLTFRAFMRIAGGDGFTVEGLDPSAGWVPLTDTEPAMTRVADGRPSFDSTSSVDPWHLTAIRLPAWLGTTARLRFVFSSNHIFENLGVYLDDIRVDEEMTDSDGDGLLGVLGEWRTFGTDPFVADTDGDGASDGDEVAAGTDPLNPADLPGVAALVPGFVLDFAVDDGGLVAGDPLWQHGTPASGPGRAHSGTQAWATNLSGNYGQHHRAFLYLPPVDLSATTSPTLSAKLWLAAGGGDGLSVEVWEPTSGEWILVAPGEPTYESVDALGGPAWRDQRYRAEYVSVALPLDAHIGPRVFLRLAFRTNHIFEGAGAYVDDLAIHDESADPDGDGVPGIIGELALGTDPFVADTDGDGASDGAEVAAGTDPLDPAWYPPGPTLLPGDVLDFEDGPDGLASRRTDWQHGVIASGPGVGASGTQGWATNLSGNYATNLREHLHLPPIDLRASSAAALTFQLWLSAGGGDGLSVERYTSAGDWATVLPVTPAYDSTDALGRPAWRQQTDGAAYVPVEISLDPYVGDYVRLRLAFRSNHIFEGAGAYVDDVAVTASP